MRDHGIAVDIVQVATIGDAVDAMYAVAERDATILLQRKTLWQSKMSSMYYPMSPN